MSWAWQPKRFRSLGFRLGVSYALIFGIASFAGISLLYWMISSHVMHGVDRRLMEQKRALAHYAAFHDRRTVQGKFFEEAGARGTSRVFYRLVSPLGEGLVSSDPSAWEGAAWDTNWLVRANGEGLVLADLELADHRGRARVLSASIARGRILQISVYLGDEIAFLAKVRTASAVFVLGMLAAGIGAGRVMARKALAGLGDVIMAVRRVADGDFRERVVLTGAGDEMARLGRTYNRMADRIETLVREMQEVNDNIAHDLRSPVTRIRGLVEMAVVNGFVPEEGIETLGSIVEECDLQIHMINTMLEISEAEAGLGEMTVGRVTVTELVSRTREMFLPLAEENGVGLDTGRVASFTVLGDLRKIQRALSNLVDNALKYTPAGGRVLLSATLENNTAKIFVTDTGIGIDLDALPRIFDRFYRADLSRSLPGNGLGLSLAMAVARAHKGTIEVESVPGRGTTCALCLPGGGSHHCATLPSVNVGLGLR
jgi:signal transduction histidine kinase